MSTSDMQDANLQEALVTYEKLQDIEDDMDEVEVEILRQQDKLCKDIYAKRAEVITKIPQFWPLVIEQAPPDVDEYIQPSDSALLLNSLTNLTVERFELPQGDPRSVSIKWEFKENEYFENKVLEKKFWWRRARDGWAGLVSEPVDIKWKDGKDLTGGMLGLVQKVWEEEKAGKEGETEAAKKLKQLMEDTGLGGVSFFAWFGFRGRKISAEEDKEAFQKEQERRAARKTGKETEEDAMDSDSDDDDEDEYEMEIFPTADDLAVCIAEDLWPGAIKYFTNAQEQDDMSDIDFESDEEMGDDDEEAEGSKDAPATKKRKA
ncbi:nucleosome assembly protein [Ilyonectria robusta]|uniref:nucleosome assembly protein n=1 Tax=Ilyonectria robusta TaxID=1079257 RepID=UPI001E8DF41F|nr:nucleosome assembly protein [Ilyonectria robusta]KAH8733346.1 nucleosome assembly protein [Ilyonectria robusta]